jgi:hypothetical protein
MHQMLTPDDENSTLAWLEDALGQAYAHGRMTTLAYLTSTHFGLPTAKRGCKNGYVRYERKQPMPISSFPFPHSPRYGHRISYTEAYQRGCFVQPSFKQPLRALTALHTGADVERADFTRFDSCTGLLALPRRAATAQQPE